ncbi:MAG: AAA family ATPase [Actinobacteria bacterium]|nr:AAA family ATPase [Actinomycetota bacterium]
MLAEHAARCHGIPVFSKDRLEATLWRSGIGAAADSGWIAYELLTTLLEGQLESGQSAIIDSVATFRRIRDGWRQLAERYGALFRVVECVCSDRALHERRLVGRVRGIPGWPELTWEQVEQTRTLYEPWDGERLILDAVSPLEENLRTLDAWLHS